jgi:hypothetical protein
MLTSAVRIYLHAGLRWWGNIRQVASVTDTSEDTWMRNYLHADLRWWGSTHRVTSVTDSSEDTWMRNYLHADLRWWGITHRVTSVTDTSEDTRVRNYLHADPTLVRNYSPSHQCHWCQWRHMGWGIIYMLTSAGDELLTAVTSVTDSSEDTWGEELFTCLPKLVRNYPLPTKSSVPLIQVKTHGRGVILWWWEITQYPPSHQCHWCQWRHLGWGIIYMLTRCWPPLVRNYPLSQQCHWYQWRYMAVLINSNISLL